MLPFALHLGWISVATVANINISFVAAGAAPSTQVTTATQCSPSTSPSQPVLSDATAALQVAAAIISLFGPVALALWGAVYRCCRAAARCTRVRVSLHARSRGDAVVPAVVSWALFAVAAKTSSGIQPFDPVVTTGIAAAAYFLACVLAAAAAVAALAAASFR